MNGTEYRVVLKIPHSPRRPSCGSKTKRKIIRVSRRSGKTTGVEDHSRGVFPGNPADSLCHTHGRAD